MQGIGMTGALGMTSSMRPTGVPPNQLRPSQSSLRPQTSSSGQAPSAQVVKVFNSDSNNERIKDKFLSTSCDVPYFKT